MSELAPLGDILVLGLTRDSYRVYKTVIGMCGVSVRFCVSFVLPSRVLVPECAGGCRVELACYVEKQAWQKLDVMATL